jgi:peptide/nickel transport system substrate-binding protein
MKLKNVVFVTVLLMLLVAFLLGACQPAPAEETQVVATDEPVADETDEVATEESATEPVSQEPQVGGTFVMEYDGDVDTFDIQKISGWGPLESFLNATMVTLDPVTNQYAPYLAESWTVSDDGLTYEFKLRQDVIFHNGDPLTAEDWIYTLERAVDPDTASPISSEYWTKVVSYEAVDDFTLRLTIAQPDYTFLLGLAQYPAAPVSQQAIEEFGEDYSRNPVGTGLYIFQEYSTGENIVLRRNPDYKWGPSWVHAGPAYIENVIIRIIPEYSTRLAGLEAGEIDLHP